jgi:hypothetical protein
VIVGGRQVGTFCQLYLSFPSEDALTMLPTLSLHTRTFPPLLSLSQARKLSSVGNSLIPHVQYLPGTEGNCYNMKSQLFRKRSSSIWMLQTFRLPRQTGFSHRLTTAINLFIFYFLGGREACVQSLPPCSQRMGARQP